VIDYRISYDKGTNGSSYFVIASGILQKSYIVTGLVPGMTYNIRIESRNVIGYSSYSNLVRALAAIVPLAPQQPSTT